MPPDRLLNSLSEDPAGSLSKVLPLTKQIACLSPDGTNFLLWERLLKVLVRHVTELPYEYLDTPSPEVDRRVDHLVFCMILWSIDDSLKTFINVNTPSAEVFQELKTRFHHPQQSSHNHVTLSSNSVLPKAPRTVSPHTSPKEPCTNLSSLPQEILELIIEYIRPVALSEAPDIKRMRCDHLEMVHPEPLTRKCQIYPLPAPAFLNSFQSLASVNRRFYELCQPLLWNHLSFPTCAPGPISMWTNGILSKHRDSIRSITIPLSLAWMLGVFSGQITECDNLIVHNPNDVQRGDLTAGQRQGLGPESVARLLVMCSSNLHTLELRIPPFNLGQPNLTFGEAEELTDLFGQLKYMVLNLANLRHLSLRTTDQADRIPDECVSDIIKEFPLLESLALSGLKRSPPPPVDPSPYFASLYRSPPPFEWFLAQHAHLSKLELTCCDNIDDTWILQSWPKTITSLRLVKCSHLTLGPAYELIESFAPNLKQLELDLAIRNLPNARNLAPRWCTPIRLPELISLSLNGQRDDCNLLTSFMEGKRLRHLKYTLCAQDLVDTVSKLVCTSTWPDLKTIHLEHGNTRWNEDGNWKMWEGLYQMQRFCDKSNIDCKVQSFDRFCTGF